jgi:pyruvate formate lyase activating enzyme
MKITLFYLFFLFTFNIFANDLQFTKEAYFYEIKDIENKIVKCNLCFRKCTIKKNEHGYCKAYKNIDGKLFSTTYNRPCAINIDPIEKKPLYHFLPSSKSLSIATPGCSFNCQFCQNWTISQSDVYNTKTYYLTPKQIVDLAIKSNSKSIAYTYTEPSIFYEYMLDTAKLAHEKGLKNLYITCGNINEKPLLELVKYIDAANVDLKGFNQKFYSKYCNGLLQTVLDTLITLKKHNVHIEITNLIIPTLNDDENEIKKMCEWIKNNLGEDTVLHFSRFFPNYKMNNLPPTPIETLIKAKKIAKEVGLKFVYIGNVRNVENSNNTICPNCKEILIKREGYNILKNNIIDQKCKFCNEKISGEF